MKESALQLTPQHYDRVRPHLRTGDLMFTSGAGMFSSLIRRFTRSPWSHVGVVVVDKVLDIVMVMEAVETGVRVVPLSLYKSYPGEIVLARWVRATKPTSELGGVEVVDKEVVIEHLADCREGVRWALGEMGQPYNSDEIMRIASRIVGLEPRTYVRGRTYICSEFVIEFLSRCSEFVSEFVGPGAVENGWDARGFISPASIAAVRAVWPLARLSKEF
jgi:hypothetical protein